jgi:hypothetical protein
MSGERRLQVSPWVRATRWPLTIPCALMMAMWLATLMSYNIEFRGDKFVVLVSRGSLYGYNRLLASPNKTDTVAAWLGTDQYYTPFGVGLRQFRLPLWMPSLALALPTGYLWFVSFRRYSPAKRCCGCHYDLSGLSKDTSCPECGRASASNP